MKQFLQVQNSDRVNRYNMHFTFPSLRSALDLTWDDGVPMHLSHDMHRLIGWSRALGIHMQPGLARLTGLSYVPENDQEASQLSGLANRHWNRILARAVLPHAPALEVRLRPHLSGNQKLCDADCAALVETGLALRMFPEVFASRDKDGLVPLTGLMPIAGGVFEKDGLLLFAHPFLRRSLSRRNGLNYPFLNCLQDHRHDPDLQCRIALDEDMIGLGSTFHEHFELDYWWGPKFTEDLEDIPLGITRHEATETDRRFHGISRTEFWWHARDGKTFECEEIRDLPNPVERESTYGCRYVHSRLNRESGVPVHLDGAIRMYGEEAMVNRLDLDMYRAGRHSQYTKLWRVDGPLRVSTWKELITHYYRDNMLIGEYFGGVDKRTEVPMAPERTEPVDEWIDVPTSMQRGDGICIHVCYLDQPEEPREPLEIQILDWLERGSERYDYVESDSFDLIKVLRRSGLTVAMRDNVTRLVFEDRVVNFPLLVLAGKDAPELATKILTAIGELCNTWVRVRRNADRLVSFSLRMDAGDRDVLLSVAGHIADVCTWLSNRANGLPASSDEWNAWLDDMYAEMNRRYPTPTKFPALTDMFENSGVLRFKRKFLAPEAFDLRMDDSGLVTDLVVPRTIENQVRSLIDAGTHGVRPCILVKESECSDCHQPYDHCGCIRFVDPAVKQIIKKYVVIGTFWTDRPD
jgi:hypothetical protein